MVWRCCSQPSAAAPAYALAHAGAGSQVIVLPSISPASRSCRTAVMIAATDAIGTRNMHIFRRGAGRSGQRCHCLVPSASCAMGMHGGGSIQRAAVSSRCREPSARRSIVVHQFVRGCGHRLGYLPRVPHEHSITSPEDITGCHVLDRQQRQACAAAPACPMQAIRPLMLPAQAHLCGFGANLP